MKSLFDADFFKFTIGFMLIIASSFALILLSGYYDAKINASVTTPAEH